MIIHHYSNRSRKKLVTQKKLEVLNNMRVSALPVSIPDLKEFVQKIQGYVVTPHSKGFDKDKTIYNNAYQADPLLIVYCICNKDVGACLELARNTKIPFRIRSSGHSFAGYSIEEGCILIDVSKMNHVAIEPKAQTLIVGPGATLDSIDVALNDFGLHLPSGSCGEVRISGYMMGGGYGFTSRMFGMNCDNVLEVMVMLADGAIVIANTGQNQDLFWAIRGGTGGNFGVLLQIKFRVVQLDNVWGFLLKYPMEKAAQVLAEVQKNYSVTCNPKLSLQSAGYLNMLPSMNFFFLGGLFIGTAKDGMKEITSLLDIGKNCLVYQDYDSYLHINQHIWDNMLGEHPHMEPSEDDLPTTVPFINTTGYLDEVLSEEQWQDIIDTFTNTSPHAPKAICMEVYGGAINQTTGGINVFGHRDVNMNLYFTGLWSETEEKPELGLKMKEAAENLTNTLSSMMINKGYFNGKCYQNYPSRALEQWSEAYWGDAYKKLANVKLKYDPEGLFDFHQSISGEAADKDVTGTSFIVQDV